MKPRKLLNKLVQGDLRNVAFKDMVTLIKSFGFALQRSRGSHHVFAHPGIPELINLQEVAGEAKPYQVRQFLRLVEKYNISLQEAK
ncbi:MAG: type II toxin-antitoxin system HicA family toxin [Thermodesulfobacteriota bacterium]